MNIYQESSAREPNSSIYLICIDEFPFVHPIYLHTCATKKNVPECSALRQNRCVRASLYVPQNRRVISGRSLQFSQDAVSEPHRYGLESFYGRSPSILLVLLLLLIRGALAAGRSTCVDRIRSTYATTASGETHYDPPQPIGEIDGPAEGHG